MITNPFPSPSTSFLAWANGFFAGFTGPSHSIEAPPDIAAGDVDAFDAGVLAGQQSAVDGIDPANPCVPAAEPSKEVTHLITGVETLHSVWEMRQLATLGAGLAGLAVVIIELAVTLPETTLPPEQVLPNLGQRLVDSLAAFGVGSLEIFCGAGSDASQEGCEIRLTPFFKTLEQAREAAVGLGRPQWVVVSWRSDQCGSFKIVDTA